MNRLRMIVVGTLLFVVGAAIGRSAGLSATQRLLGIENAVALAEAVGGEAVIELRDGELWTIVRGKAPLDFRVCRKGERAI